VQYKIKKTKIPTIYLWKTWINPRSIKLYTGSLKNSKIPKHLCCTLTYMAKWTGVQTSIWTSELLHCGISGRTARISKKNWWTDWRRTVWNVFHPWMRMGAAGGISSGRNWFHSWTGAGLMIGWILWSCRASSRGCPLFNWKCHSRCAAHLFGTQIFWKSMSN